MIWIAAGYIFWWAPIEEKSCIDCLRSWFHGDRRSPKPGFWDELFCLSSRREVEDSEEVIGLKMFLFFIIFSLSFRWDLHTRKRILLYIRRLLWMTAPAVTLTSLSSTEASTMEAAMAAEEWSILTMVYPSSILVMRWTTRCSSALLLLLRHFSPVCWMLPRRLTEVWRMWGLLKTGWEFPLLLFTWNVYFQHICSNAISSSWKGTISYVIKLTK